MKLSTNVIMLVIHKEVIGYAEVRVQPKRANEMVSNEFALIVTSSNAKAFLPQEAYQLGAFIQCAYSTYINDDIPREEKRRLIKSLIIQELKANFGLECNELIINTNLEFAPIISFLNEVE